MFSPQRYSFRQLLLVAFLLIALLLGAASLSGLFLLENLLQQSSEGTRQAVASTADAQLLAERTVAMERAARQYLVLGDAALRQRYDEAAGDAQAALARLAADHIAEPLARQWRAAAAPVGSVLHSADAADLMREPAVTAAFRALDGLNAQIADEVRRATQERNAVLERQLDAGRTQIALRSVAAIAFTIALALGFGVWLARPLRSLESAMVGLGENRLEEAIEVRGPADVRRLGRRLEWLRLRLAELDADKARFLRHVSHELKTPLAALREGVALLEEGVAGSLSSSQREVVRILKQNTAALQAQIEDLLRFNAAAFEARQLVRRSTDLAALLRDVVAGQRLQWMAQQLQVEVQGDSLVAEVDAEKLSTAVGNLLSNAIRFSPPGARITLSLSRIPGRACIDITDQGPGVAPGDRARIFEPFYRGERQPAGAARGSGIGLSIVNEYITAHGGHVELLDDAPGAHFHIELPHAA